MRCEFTLCAFKGLSDCGVFCLVDTTDIGFSVRVSRPIIGDDRAGGPEEFDLDVIERKDLVDRRGGDVMEVGLARLADKVRNDTPAEGGLLVEVHHAEPVLSRDRRVRQGLLVGQLEGVDHHIVHRAVDAVDLLCAQLPAEVDVHPIGVHLLRGEHRTVPADSVELQQVADHRGVSIEQPA